MNKNTWTEETQKSIDDVLTAGEELKKKWNWLTESLVGEVDKEKMSQHFELQSDREDRLLSLIKKCNDLYEIFDIPPLDVAGGVQAIEHAVDYLESYNWKRGKEK